MSTTKLGEAPREFRVIGTRPIRHDGIDKVTGRAVYGADVTLPGLLQGSVLRSPHAHARILSIDTTRAAALPGVKAIVTSEDLPNVRAREEKLGESVTNVRHLSENILAHDKVLYHGHAIAAVAATSAHIAEEAAALIDVKYEVLPPVLDVRKAMQDDAPILHPDLRTHGGDPERADRETNVAAVTHFERGDIEAGFAQADEIIERSFDTAMVHQGYIEPHNAVAQVNADGQATLWCSTQGHFDVRRLCADVLEMPLSRLKVVAAEIGGGFGGKTTIYLEPLAILLSRKSGAPVKLVMSRADVLQATGPTSGSHIRVKMGANRDGRITAVDAWLAYEAGGYPGSPVQMGAACIIGPFDIENVRIYGYDVVVNRPKTAAYRAPGASNAAYASETIVDELAHRLEIDPFEFRLANAAKEGTPTAAGPRHRRIGCVELLEAARSCPHATAPLGDADGPRKRGRGFATGFWFNAGLQSSATISLNSDGTASLVTGSPDIGGTRTSCAMMAAEELGLPIELVRPVVGDTDSIGHTDVTGGSRVTMATGLAVHDAAHDIKRQLCERAAKTWKVEVDQVRFEEDGVVSVNDESQRFSLAEIAKNAIRTGGPIVGRATVNAQRNTGAAYAGLMVDVEVDTETGRVDITRCTVFQDVGRAIHPAYVEGQMQGGSVQGIGWALNEEYVYDDEGHLLNDGFLDYRMPVALDLPMIDPVIVEVANPAHPYGVRGVGEVSIVPPPGAVANAIADATGVRMTTLPMSPPRVLAALKAHAAGE
ncbi:MAG: xanthine dehydrogenase family protein molybdopterin-binding subunit [Candidatus Binatia bacterium]|nr:xanthine dehydrogenase family protein molybdopterin-binding subunit [Candidatus Binatia bacterium]